MKSGKTLPQHSSVRVGRILCLLACIGLLVGLLPGQALAQNVPPAPQVDELPPIPDIPDLDGNLGPAEDTGGVADLLGDDGVFTWNDGDREMRLTLADPSSGGPAALRSDGSGLAKVASAYASPDGLAQSAAPSNWFESGTGESLLLVGGVVVIIEEHLSAGAVSSIFDRHNISPDRVLPLGEMPNGFLVETVSDVETLTLVRSLSSEPGVRSVSPNTYTPEGHYPHSDEVAQGSVKQLADCSVTNPPLSDKQSHCLWHLDAETSYRFLYQGPPTRVVDPTIDVNIDDVWDTTMGAGVKVVVVDHAADLQHQDLRANWDRQKTVRSSTGAFSNNHGTAVAGILGARDNQYGGRGVAPRATLISHDFLDNQSTASQTQALTLHHAEVAVYNMSYGRSGGSQFSPRSTSWHDAITIGITAGFGGKGANYVTSAGNGWDNNEEPGRTNPPEGTNWTTLEEKSNHVGMIAVCAVDSDGDRSPYSEQGPSLWVCAPSSSYINRPGIFTTTNYNGYTIDFGGTSAAAPMVSGVIALMRSINGDLTWRDVKVILANTAQKNDPTNSSWQLGGVRYGPSEDRYHFSNEYGFGVVDAKAAVEAAANWPLLPELKKVNTTYSGTSKPLPTGGQTMDLTFNVPAGTMDFTEHVGVELDVDSSDFRDFRVTLISPSGATSLLAPEAVNAESRYGKKLHGSFRFGSARHLGEDPSGTWTIRIENKAPSSCRNNRNNGTGGTVVICPGPGTFYSWKATIHGHQSSEWVTLSASSQEVNEGESVAITATVSGDAPTQNLVTPIVLTPETATSSDYSAPNSITIPAGSNSGSADIQITADNVVDADEAFTVEIGTLPGGYRTLPQSIGIVIKEVSAEAPLVKYADLIDRIKRDIQDPHYRNEPSDLKRVLKTLGVPEYANAPGGPVGVQEATNRRTLPNDNPHWEGIAEAIQYKLDYDAGTVNPPPAIPEITITGGNGITEGGTASFTITASPAPASAITVNVGVSQDGSWGVSGPATVSVSGASTSYTVSTSDDEVDEADGSVTATINSGDGYTVGSASSASVNVADDDDPPPVIPEVTITGGSGVTEGGTASFTITADPAPTSAITVKVGVTQNGDWDATGPATVSVSGASTSYTITTSDDETDETDGSVTATIESGTGYTVGSASSASVAVADDDDPAPVVVAPLVKYATLITNIYDTYITDHNRDDVHNSRWKRVLKAFGHADYQNYQLDAMTSAEAQQIYDDNQWPRWEPIGEALVYTEAYVNPPGVIPQVTITGGIGVTEGGTASFTITADPAPSGSITVKVGVTQNGSWGATGPATITVSGATTSYTITTSDDQTDEADGSVTATIKSGDGYTVGSASSASVNVADDDPTPEPPLVKYATLITNIYHTYITDHGSDDVHNSRWKRVLKAFGHADYVNYQQAAMTSTEAQQIYNNNQWPRWEPIGDALAYTEAYVNPPGVIPQVTITGGSGITEGGTATFTINANPAPASAITVNVGVTQNGDWDASGATTITVSGASTTYTIRTTDDQTDETDGSVTATIKTGTGYTVGTASSASVNVADNDDPPPATPEITITGGSGITEGGTATFTIEADPAPSGSITVNVGVTQNGDWNATGPTTVSVSGASTTYTITTSDDQTDEPDGTVTATIQTGTGYTIGQASTASVNVADNDDPPVVPEITITAGNGITEGGTASFTINADPAPAGSITVNVGVTQNGDWNATGPTTVSVSGATTTYTITTSDDQTDEADGSVTATIKSGTGYTIGSASSASVNVADDDDPPVVPEITITGGSGITEGGTATFTIEADPAPSGAITVNVGVTQNGDWDATGPTTITVSGATTTYTVTTTDDQTDETDGTVTATIKTGTGYTIGTASTASVNVADDDPAPVGNSDTLMVTTAVQRVQSPQGWFDPMVGRPGQPLIFEITTDETAQQDVTISYTVASFGLDPAHDYCLAPDDLEDPTGFSCPTLPQSSEHPTGTVTIKENAQKATVTVIIDPRAWIRGWPLIHFTLTHVTGAKGFTNTIATANVRN